MARRPSRGKPAGRKAASSGRKKPTRKAPAKRASPKRKRAPARRASARRKPTRHPLRRALFGLFTGAVLGIAVVFGILYVDALDKVDNLMSRPLWAESGQVASAPVEVWPGMQVDAEDVAQVLQAAGYSRVAQVSAPGDFQVSEDALVVQRAAASGPGWSVPAGDVLITFRNDRVATVSPENPAVFGPSELAGIRGADSEARRPVTRDVVPRHLVQAVLAMEDGRFFEHRGVDPWGIIRALGVNILAGGTAQGGSTLTQQLAKNLFLSKERTIERKLREAVLAFALESRLTKDELLTLYLNQVYLGQVGGVAICGVDQAARVYFGQSAQRIGLGQAATLAGVISAPNRYSPLKHPKRAQTRRDLVLDRMVAMGWLESGLANREKARPLGAVVPTRHRRAPWAVDSAIAQVETKMGEGVVSAQAVAIGTTIQPLLQRIAERAVKKSRKALAKHFPQSKGAQMALVAVRADDGAIVAMVGGGDYGGSTFNRAMDGRRQIGSTVKPLTWLLAFEDDPTLSPTTPVPDQEIERQVGEELWAPTNYDGEYLGVVSLGEALAQSRNVPAVLLAERVGMSRLKKAWRSMGLSGATEYPSAALGAFEGTPVELAGAYTVFPGKGQSTRPRLVRSVRLPDGREGWREGVERTRQTSERAAFLATSTLVQVVEEGTGRRVKQFGVRGVVGGKTGTTDEENDAWFVGFTDTLAVAVWVGFDKSKNLGLTGAQAAAPAWARFVSGSGTEGSGFSAPESVVGVDLCVESGAIAIEECPESESAWFTTEAAPAELCPTHGEVDEGEAARMRAIERVRERLDEVGDEPPRQKRGWFRRRKSRD